MNKLVVSTAVLAGLVMTSPVALAQDDAPSAEVKAAICASASTDAVSFPADGRVANARTRQGRAVIEQGQRDAAANAKDTVNGIVTEDAIVARISEIEAFLKTELAPDVRKLHEDILALRKKQLAATREAEAANDELQRALAAQKDAVDLEAEVRVFVGDQSYATVKSDLCDPEPTPTTTPPPRPPPPRRRPSRSRSTSTVETCPTPRRRRSSTRTCPTRTTSTTTMTVWPAKRATAAASSPRPAVWLRAAGPLDPHHAHVGW